MKKIFILISVISMLIEVSSYAFENGDFQYWNNESVSLKIKKSWKVTLAEEFRFGDNSSVLYYEHTDIGIVYSGLAKWLDLGINYRHIYEKNKGKWQLENRPHFNATFKFSFFDLDLSNRALFEYRIRKNKHDYWRYRNKLTVKFPLKLTRFKIQPYTADEIFFDLDKEKVDRNRIYMGFNIKLTDDLQGDIYYMIQSSKNEKWEHWNIFGTSLKLLF
ncbi:MAG: DUF2490 domain-containing protein [Candidatus Omnitrophica bacterium]|nr:DUF2490 domain-containing protein [Candidatus Omnitrophota bacterium]